MGGVVGGAVGGHGMGQWWSRWIEGLTVRGAPSAHTCDAINMHVNSIAVSTA